MTGAPGDRTLRHHFTRTPDGPSNRLERLCGILVDNRRLGDYPIGVPRSREDLKRFIELQWAAIALVGCDADLEILELRTIAPRHDRPTADFEATLLTGAVERIELARITFELEQQQNEYFASIAGDVQAILEKSTGSVASGTFMYRVYDPDGTTIGRNEANRAASELASFIHDHDEIRAETRKLIAVDDLEQDPILTRLGVYVFCEKKDGPLHVMWDPLLEPLDPEGAIDIFNRVRAEKAIKIGGYSDDGGVPVWLLFAVESLKQRYLGLSVVQSLAGMDAVDPRPFKRVLVGCYTAGVTFIEPFRKPVYTSLSTTG